MDLWTRILEGGECIDTIYLDFAKAFDTVPHERLLLKLSQFGIKGHVLNWVRSFLIGRKQKVVLKGEEPQWRDVLSGVPQANVLGPVLFVLL